MHTYNHKAVKGIALLSVLKSVYSQDQVFASTNALKIDLFCSLTLSMINILHLLILSFWSLLGI